MGHQDSRIGKGMRTGSIRTPTPDRQNDGWIQVVWIARLAYGHPSTALEPPRTRWEQELPDKGGKSRTDILDWHTIHYK